MKCSNYSLCIDCLYYPSKCPTQFAFALLLILDKLKLYEYTYDKGDRLYKIVQNIEVTP